MRITMQAHLNELCKPVAFRFDDYRTAGRHRGVQEVAGDQGPVGEEFGGPLAVEYGHEC